MRSTRHEIQNPYSVPAERMEGEPYPENTSGPGFVGSSKGEKGYHLLFFHSNAKWRIGLLVMFLIIGISGAFYFWYSRTANDASPDSLVGFGYAILGTTFL